MWANTVGDQCGIDADAALDKIWPRSGTVSKRLNQAFNDLIVKDVASAETSLDLNPIYQPG